MMRLHQTGAVALGVVLNRGETQNEYYDYNSPWTGVATEQYPNINSNDRPASEQV